MRLGRPQGLAPWEKLEAVRSLRSPAAVTVDGSMDEEVAAQRGPGNGVIMVSLFHCR